MNKQIICKNAGIGYEGNVVCDGISFEISAGDYFCILGENGTGKSTLIKSLLGLQPVAGGEISFCGIKKQDMGYLPQQTAVQKDFPATVSEIVMSGCLGDKGVFPFYKKEDKLKAKTAMERLDIVELSQCSYRELSGGQQQRVLLARALCAAKKMILLDEPAAGLDTKSAEEMYKIVEKLNKDGLTVIMVSHDPECIAYASHILHLGKKSLFCGTKADYMKSEAAKLFMRREKR